jgi:hypothetical protein
MGIVIITCPHSHEEISTGIEMDEASFSKLPDVVVRSHCPRCGMQHAWWTREAKLIEEAAFELPVQPLMPAAK